MRSVSVLLLILGVVLVFTAGQRFVSSADDRVQSIPDTVPADAADRSGPLMQAKLVMSQRVLEGLLSSDFALVKTSAQALHQFAESDRSHQDDGLQDRIYEHFRTEFIRLSKQLETMADEQNLPGAAYAHQNLTATCIACHNHLRDGRED